MKHALLALAVFGVTLAGAAQHDHVTAAAAKFAPKVSWDPASVLSLDFTCRGRIEYAILGATAVEEVLVEGRPVGQRAPELVVAVFVEGLNHAPRLFQDSARSVEFASLSAESLDFRKSDIEQAAGLTPEGLRPSRTCKGLKLSSDSADSAHLYWSQVRRDISIWSR
jgi:hypothetical protein